MASKRAIILHESDTVANVVEPVEAGDMVEARIGQRIVPVRATESVPFEIGRAHV